MDVVVTASDAEGRGGTYDAGLRPTAEGGSAVAALPSGATFALACSAAAGASAPLSFAWHLDGVRVRINRELGASNAGSDGGFRVTGHDSPRLVVREATSFDAGAYTCTVSNSAGSAISGGFTHGRRLLTATRYTQHPSQSEAARFTLDNRLLLSSRTRGWGLEDRIRASSSPPLSALLLSRTPGWGLDDRIRASSSPPLPVVSSKGPCTLHRTTPC